MRDDNDWQYLGQGRQGRRKEAEEGFEILQAQGRSGVLLDDHSRDDSRVHLPVPAVPAGRDVLVHQFAGLRRLQVHRLQELHRDVPGRTRRPRVSVHDFHRDSDHARHEHPRHVPGGAAELQNRLQERLPSHLLHSVHPVGAGHRLRVQVHLHDPAAGPRPGAAHRLAVHIHDLQSGSGMVPDRVPVHLAGCGLLHAAVLGGSADHRQRNL